MVLLQHVPEAPKDLLSRSTVRHILKGIRNYAENSAAKSCTINSRRSRFVRGHKCLFVDPIRQVRRLGFQPCQNLLATPEGFSLRLSFFTVRRSLPDSGQPNSTFHDGRKTIPEGVY